MSSRATTFLGGTRSSREESFSKASFATSGDMTAPGTPQGKWAAKAKQAGLE